MKHRRELRTPAGFNLLPQPTSTLINSHKLSSTLINSHQLSSTPTLIHSYTHKLLVSQIPKFPNSHILIFPNSHILKFSNSLYLASVLPASRSVGILGQRIQARYSRTEFEAEEFLLCFPREMEG
jgi:hypothetical protein